LFIQPKNEEIMIQSLTVLGSTGSIGVQALDVAEQLGFRIEALACGRAAALFEKQVRKHKPKFAAVFDEAAAKLLAISLGDTPVKILSGEEGVCACAAAGADCVLNAVVGIAGLKPTVAALQAGRHLALANKESLVAGGALVTKLADTKNIQILPVDSEHSAIFQCMQGAPPNQAIKKILLTASGGPFFGKTKAELKSVTLEQALKHPNWSMGAKITVDSATMMNKALEMIEAAWLFDVSEDQIEVLVHRQSVVHSMVEFADGAVIAQLGVPDMRLPIQYALTYPERIPCNHAPLDFVHYPDLTFAKPDEVAFPALRLAREALRAGGFAGTVLNAANEAANELFRGGSITFTQISELVESVIDTVPKGNPEALEDVLEVDVLIRQFVFSRAGK
jgi:1-deoxy-D-xylulose-5-phosphate reductoisomerase